MLREFVLIKTPAGYLTGELFVGEDWLPELVLDSQRESESYRPATFPAAWIVISFACGPLYSVWHLICNLIEEIAVAEREAKAEEVTKHEQPAD